MISSDPSCYLNFSSALSHLSDEAYRSVKEKLVHEVSKTIGFQLTNVTDMTLAGRHLSIHGVKEVDLTQDQAERVSKALVRAISFIRNTSSIEYGTEYRKEAIFTLNPPPETFKTAFQRFVYGPFVKGISLFKDGLAAFSFKSAQGVVTKSFGMTAGVIDIISGWDEYYDALKEQVESLAVRDKEGYERAEAKLVQSELQLGAGGLFIGQSVTAFAAPGASGIAAAACVPLILLFSTIGTVIGLALSVFGIQRCNTFLERLDEYLENPHLSKEQQISGALRFLQEQISISPEEEVKLKESGESEQEIIEKTRQLIENKMRHVKRRTSLKSLWSIANIGPVLLKQIELGGSEGKEAMDQALVLIEQVKKSSQNKRLLYAAGLFAIVLGFAALIAGVVLTGGALALIIGLAAGMICFALALYTWIETRRYRLPELESEKQPELIYHSLS